MIPQQLTSLLECWRKQVPLTRLIFTMMESFYHMKLDRQAYSNTCREVFYIRSAVFLNEYYQTSAVMYSKIILILDC